jgi:adenylosuccinate lyase
MEVEKYESPLKTRYGSVEMQEIFSDHFKYTTWRKLWIALAEAQKELGLDITNEQIEELKAHALIVDKEKVHSYEKMFRHEVMAHLYAFSDVCPKARGIIHLGATSSYVMDNGDLIQMLSAMKLLRGKCILLIEKLNHFALKHAAVPCLGLTHFQPAQVTTVGKRAALWLQDFLFDFRDLTRIVEEFPFLGVKGAIGSQASFLALFEGDQGKVEELEEKVAEKMGFTHSFLLTSQTFPRKQEQRLLSVLSGIAASAHKCATDLRLLSHLNEIEEPFEHTQVGSSAMPYKRNPILSERICGLARFVMNLSHNSDETVALQWLERSLDDSSNRRLTIPEAFLATDSILNLLCYIIEGLSLFPKIMETRLEGHLPYLATEHIMAAAVLRGKDRQKVHEKLRLHCFEASKERKETGKPSDLLKRITHDPDIGLSEKEIAPFLLPETLIGRSKEQVISFLKLDVQPILEKYLTLKITTPPIEI